MNGTLHRWLFTALLAATLLPPLLYAQPATAPAADADIPELITQLTSEKWPVRESAQKKLIAIGEPVREPVKLALENSTDEELRVRTQAIIAALDDNALVGPSIITLHMKDAQPRDIFAALSTQCRATLESNNPSMWRRQRSPVTIDIDHLPFWQAMEEVSRKTGIQISRGSTDLNLVEGMSEQGPSDNRGLLRITANSASYNRSVSFMAGGGASRANFNVQFTAMAEPRVQVQSAVSQPVLTEAVDDNGNSLLPKERINSYYYGGQAGNYWSFVAQLNYPDNPGKKIARIKGWVSYELKLKSETLEIPDIRTAKNVVRTVGPFTLTVVQVEQKENQYEVKVKLTADTLPSGNEAPQLHMFLNQIRLVDANGNNLPTQGSTSGGSPGSIEGSMTYVVAGTGKNNQPIGDPAKLTWEVATETRPMRAEFEFKDLPMP